MFRFDDIKQCFVELTDSQRLELKKELINLIVKGIPCMGSKYFKAWCNQYKFEDNTKKMLLMATSYPQHALLSLIPDCDM